MFRRAHHGQFCHWLTGAALLFSLCPPAWGCWRPAVTRSQIAAMFLPLAGTPSRRCSFRGSTNPVSSLVAARWIGEVYPATHMFPPSAGACSARRCRLQTRARVLTALAILALAIPALRCCANRGDMPVSRLTRNACTAAGCLGTLANIWRLGIRSCGACGATRMMLDLIVYTFTRGLQRGTAMPRR